MAKKRRLSTLTQRHYEVKKHLYTLKSINTKKLALKASVVYDIYRACFSAFFCETRSICNLTLLLKLHNQNKKRESGHGRGHYVI